MSILTKQRINAKEYRITQEFNRDQAMEVAAGMYNYIKDWKIVNATTTKVTVEYTAVEPTNGDDPYECYEAVIIFTDDNWGNITLGGTIHDCGIFTEWDDWDVSEQEEYVVENAKAEGEILSTSYGNVYISIATD